MVSVGCDSRYKIEGISGTTTASIVAPSFRPRVGLAWAFPAHRHVHDVLFRLMAHARRYDCCGDKPWALDYAAGYSSSGQRKQNAAGKIQHATNMAFGPGQ
jgi:hypothetical protein